MPNHLTARVAGIAALLASLAACTSSGSHPSATSDTPTGRLPSSAATTGATSSSSALRSSTTPSTDSSSTSGTKPATGDAALVGKADAICAAGNAYRKMHPFPVENFDPSNPDVQALPKIASYLKKGPDVAAGLLRLDLPLGVATALTQEQKNEKAQIAAAASSDPQTYAHVAKDGQVVSQHLRSAFKPAGLTAADACLDYFAS